MKSDSNEATFSFIIEKDFPREGEADEMVLDDFSSSLVEKGGEERRGEDFDFHTDLKKDQCPKM